MTPAAGIPYRALGPPGTIGGPSYPGPGIPPQAPLFQPGGDVARDDLIEFDGKVAEVLAGGNFKVALENGHSVLARLSGRMRRFHIRVVIGDRVTVAVSPYDPTRGFITFRT